MPPIPSDEMSSYRYPRYGGKLLDVKGTSSRASKLRAQRAMMRVQAVNARSISYNFKRVFSSMGRDFEALDDVPDVLDTKEIIAKHQAWETHILEVSYGKVAEQVYPLIADEEGLKAMEVSMETKGTDTSTELYKLKIMDWIRKYCGVHIVKIDDTTLKDVQRIMEKSSSTQDFKEKIAPYFKTSALYRADRIARTESHAAANLSADISVRSTDVGRKTVKTWSVTHVNTRATHLMMDGVTVGMDELFTIPKVDGGYDKMSFPGDSSHGASAGNIVNCRCLCFYKYES